MHIAVIGFGFSGLMVTTQLVRLAAPGTTIYVIGDTLTAQGVAYSTTNVEHLLNVPAARMGAFPDKIDDFFIWLGTADAALAKQQLGITREYAATDFVPRALYAAYLQTIWRDCQVQASGRGVFLKLIESEALAISERHGLAVLTARGDAIAVDKIVLATGNETKPILPGLAGTQVVQNPWARGVFDHAAEWDEPVVLMGVGLTAVDTVLSLRSAGYSGQIVAFSRNGLLPQAHAPINSIYAFNADQLLMQPDLALLMKHVRTAMKTHGEWRPVVDALRPHTQALWQRLTTREQQHFLKRVLTVWNVHRHRMAPEIAERIEDEIARGTLRIISSRGFEARLEDEKLQVTLRHAGGEEVLKPSRLINCTGPQMAVAKSDYTLLTQAVADGMIEPHATGLGIAADPYLRAWGVIYPNLYVMGTLATGQLLESTAVPELRVQARQVAESLTEQGSAA